MQTRSPWFAVGSATSCGSGSTLAGWRPLRGRSGVCGCARRRWLLRASGAILPHASSPGSSIRSPTKSSGSVPIESLLRDPDVTEVMVNGPDDVYVERKGRIERVPDGLFEGEEAVLHLIERIVGPLGLRVDESSPWADARLPDGSSCPRDRSASFAPRSRAHDPEVLAGPDRRRRSVADRHDRPAGMFVFLGACVRGRANLVVSAAPARERPRCSASCRRSSPTMNGSSPSRMRRSCDWPSLTWSRWRLARRTSRAGARSPSETSCETPFGCVPTASSSGRSEAARRSTCSRR